MRRRRILYIANSHPDLYIGGAEVYSYEVYRAMRSSADFEPIFLARSVAPAHPEPRTIATSWRSLPVASRTKSAARAASA